jgi:hypothetical protein
MTLKPWNAAFRLQDRARICIVVNIERTSFRAVLVPQGGKAGPPRPKLRFHLAFRLALIILLHARYSPPRSWKSGRGQLEKRQLPHLGTFLHRIRNEPATIGARSSGRFSRGGKTRVSAPMHAPPAGPEAAKAAPRRLPPAKKHIVNWAVFPYLCAQCTGSGARTNGFCPPF